MRRFSSYGQINPKLHYYAPRTGLIEQAYTQLLGEHPEEGGHYITVWAPRQTGKSTVLLEAAQKLRQHEEHDVVLITMESAKYEEDPQVVLRMFVRELQFKMNYPLPNISSWEDFPLIFHRECLKKPLILVIDEFDTIAEQCINKFASEFRKIHTDRITETGKTSAEKTYLLHGLALIGVRSVLGIENVSGSPFNVQRSVHIPNLTFEEMDGMFTWYERESGQQVEQDVIERLYAETNGHPGLTCWFGELLTEGFEDHPSVKEKPITLAFFDIAYQYATYALPNNTILNILSKAEKEPYRDFVLRLFKTGEKLHFRYHDKQVNYLYMNGVIDREQGEDGALYLKFSNPFVQKYLFQYFSNELFQELGKLFDPFENLEDTITETRLNIPNLMKRYERHLRENKAWLLKDAPRRGDLRIYEAVYHFHLYMYVFHFLKGFGGKVYPEFPTGNSKIDLIIKYGGKVYGLEVKSYTTRKDYQDALLQAARYGKQLHLTEISLVIFVESIDEKHRNMYEAAYLDQDTGTTVFPIFVETGC